MFESLWRLIKSVNKKVWVTVAFLAVFFAAGTTWIVVANAAAAFKPANWDGLSNQDIQTVSGNGGPAVMVGNWLYFVGNYVDSSTIKYRQNEHNKVTYGAIYRVYIDPSVGSPLYEDGGRLLSNPDYIAHLLDETKFDLIVPKVAGFDQAALWVFGKHLVYTSPNNTKDKVGQLQLGKIDFFRVDLDGRNHRKIYTTSSDAVTTKDFTVASYIGKIFLLIKDGNIFRSVSVTDKPGQVVTVSENVQSVVLPVVTSYLKQFDYEGRVESEGQSLDDSYFGIMNFVYYTEALEEEEQEIGLQGNRLFQYNVRNDAKTDVYINGHSVSVLALANGRLVYSVSAADAQYGAGSESLGVFMTEKPISDSYTAPLDIVSDNKLLLDEWAYQDEEFYLPTEATPGVTFRWATFLEGKIYLYEKGKALPVKTITDVGSIITVTGSTVHYLDSNGAVCAVGLSGTAEPLANAVPETSIRPWVISRNSLTWYFHIKNLQEKDDENHEHEESDVHVSTTVAALYNLSGSTAREFLLGRVDCAYFTKHDSCD